MPTPLATKNYIYGAINNNLCKVNIYCELKKIAQIPRTGYAQEANHLQPAPRYHQPGAASLHHRDGIQRIRNPRRAQAGGLAGRGYRRLGGGGAAEHAEAEAGHGQPAQDLPAPLLRPPPPAAQGGRQVCACTHWLEN